MSEQVQGFRLSPQQRHVWRLQAESRAYRSQCALLLDGELDAEALRQALTGVAGRHEVLRTGFRRSPGIRFPLQVVAETAPPPLWQTADLSDKGDDAVDDLFRQAARRPFDLERGPLVHAWLAALGPGRHLLVLGVPALCADRTGLRNLVRDLIAAYAGAVPEEEAVQYSQFSDWQNELLESEESLSGRELWRRQEQAAPLGWRLPLEGSPTGAGGYAPERAAVPVAPDLAARIDALARDCGAPSGAVLLAAWQALLVRLTGEPRLGVGLVLDGRQQEGLEDAVGLFARCVPLASRAEPGDTFRHLVERAQAAWSEASDWQVCYAPEEGERAVAGMPAGFELVERGEGGEARGVSFSPRSEVSFIERFKVSLVAARGVRGGGSLSLELCYDPRFFAADYVQTLAGRFIMLLGALVAEPDRPVWEAELLTAEERHRLLAGLNATAAPYPADRSIHQLFEEQAARTPEAPAVELLGERLTYAELNGRANRLARFLRSGGVGPDTVVGVCMERSFDMVAALLGVLKAGGAYLPLDSTYPRERLAFMAADSGVRTVLTQSRLAELLPEGPHAVRLDAEWERIAGLDGSDLGSPASPEHLAYVLYTSGSTGNPKGVMVPHRGVVNYLSWAAAAYGAAAGEGAPLHSPLGFDLTVTSLFLPLLSGNAVRIVPEDRGVDALANMLRGESGFSLLKVTPAHLALLGQALAHDDLAGRVGTLILGGEALLGEHVAPWRERLGATRLINEYGPTEATVGCCVYEVPAEGAPARSVPIGKPIANTRLLLLDAALRPVPEGAPGEIYVGGDGLARGYLGRPELTAERFVPDPFAGRETPAAPGSRLYRTGDLARLLPGGDLDFLGRNDHQVKVRGVRIELGEVEAALAAHPAVREAAVLAREDTPGDRRLVAYFTAAEGQGFSIDELRRFLATRLPDAMLPAVFVPLPAMPLTANGKLDRAALPAPGSQRPDLEREYVAPRTPLEETLSEVWAEVLGIDKVGVLDSFFALGGDSIRSVRVVALAKERGVDLTVEQLFRYQTIEALIQGIGGESDAALGASEDEDLARLVAELETLSEEEAQQRLRQQIAAVEETA